MGDCNNFLLLHGHKAVTLLDQLTVVEIMDATLYPQSKRKYKSFGCVYVSYFALSMSEIMYYCIYLKSMRGGQSAE